MQILSFQSAVAYGHVGNSAAVFPLQRLGFDVWPVDTVQFSNHPGHGGWKGAAMAAPHLADVVEGLRRVGTLAALDGVLSGYLGEAAAGVVLLDALDALPPGALYLCDPVMGDDGPGLYVKAGIPAVLADKLIPAAQVVTPNRFELSLLTGLPVADLGGAVVAARRLLAPASSGGRGPRLVVVSSLTAGEGSIACLAVSADGAWRVATPRLDFPHPPNGAGDLLSALLLGHLLKGTEAPEALSLAVSSVFGVLTRTRALGRRELALVAAQAEIVTPSRLFPAEAM
ncbi:pyridoxal kinase [Paramagnetospirillum marisnigri]|uniref:pyridoxal kinase n=1 Tax=Paramagnetospirillum marisnigri TaxID=1285242 RepID=A0A178MH49_9PROT|nr:pyridoxal kinase PdxY [Paramagnetospirillum marisnigri]OAN48011.1 pyridoxal kinase [Paramagnetospirillum marisnigri]